MSIRDDASSDKSATSRWKYTHGAHIFRPTWRGKLATILLHRELLCYASSNLSPLKEINKQKYTTWILPIQFAWRLLTVKIINNSLLVVEVGSRWNSSVAARRVRSCTVSSEIERDEIFFVQVYEPRCELEPDRKLHVNVGFEEKENQGPVTWSSSLWVFKCFWF